jgi:hypothetical protein
MSRKDDFGILVVDDEEMIVKSLRRTLRREGFDKVVSALSAEQGIKLLEDTRNSFFLIISDQRMPGMSGSEFLEKSILLNPESRRMLLTAYADLDAVIDAVNRGEIHQYISKPWNDEDLVLRIKGEQETFNRMQERKHLYKITQRQNKKLYRLASGLQKNLEGYTGRLNLKKEETALLTQAVKEAKEQAEYKEVFLGLEELLSRTITIDQRNLAQAFDVCVKEAVTVFKTITRKNHLPLPDHGSSTRINVDELENEIFDTIDPIIENVVQAVESKLFGIGAEPLTGVTIDDYKVVPDFGTLAFNDGYITKGELEQAGEELEEKEAESSTGLTLDRILISSKFIRRRDLSRIFAKMALIETRLLDREFSKMLLDREVLKKKDVDRAFRKQLNNFEDSGVTTLLGDILVESDVIAAGLRDEVMAAQDRSGARKSDSDGSLEFSSEYGAYVDLQVSENRVEAWIRVPAAIHGTADIKPVKDLIKKRGIRFGVVEDLEIRRFIKGCTDPTEKFVVARGTPAGAGKPARVIYHFNTEPESAGKVREDGSIDFTSRGESAFIKKGQVLAEKTPMEHPRQGRDIFGQTLEVVEVEDASIQGGDGTEISEDGLKLTATRSGQPSLDMKGVVTVLEQFTVRGDVGFKTGNISFNGNVLVTGAVTEGFSVECAELVCNEINGGTITAAGDVKVSNGIVNAAIETQGGLQAKFVNRSKIFAFKDVLVTREIMASTLLISGKLDNTTGRITASSIAARLGLDVKQIGTEKAAGSVIKLGMDDHAQWIAQRYDLKLAEVKERLEQGIKEKLKITERYNALHVDIANQTFAQDKMNKKIEAIEKMMGTSDQKEEKKALAAELKELEINIEKANERIQGIFEAQDMAQKKIAAFDTDIHRFHQETKDLETEKQKVLEQIQKNDPIPMLKVGKKIFAGTRILGMGSARELNTDCGMAKFEGTGPADGDGPGRIVQHTL